MRYLLWLSLLVSATVSVADTRNPALLAATCAACHGTEGRNQADTKSLAGIDKAYFLEQMALFNSGEREATVMQTYAKGLTEEEIAVLADYFSQLAP